MGNTKVAKIEVDLAEQKDKELITKMNKEIKKINTETIPNLTVDNELLSVKLNAGQNVEEDNISSEELKSKLNKEIKAKTEKLEKTEQKKSRETLQSALKIAKQKLKRIIIVADQLSAAQKKLTDSKKDKFLATKLFKNRSSNSVLKFNNVKVQTKLKPKKDGKSKKSAKDSSDDGNNDDH